MQDVVAFHDEAVSKGWMSPAEQRRLTGMEHRVSDDINVNNGTHGLIGWNRISA